jgi:hypothetical protein
MNRRLPILLAVSLVLVAIGTAFAQAGVRGAENRGVPNLDVSSSCRESTFLDCRSQEQRAREILINEWSDYTAQERRTCAKEAKQAGPPSYIVWLTCLQINENVRKSSASETERESSRNGGQ